MRRKFFSILTALALVLSLCPTWAFAAEGDPDGTQDNPWLCGAEGDNLTAWLSDDKTTLTIKGTGAMADYDDFENTSPWSGSSSKIKNVSLPDGLTTIGEYAFFSTNLQEAAIPEGVTTIGANAFQGSKLREVTIPDSVTEIGANAFFMAGSLTSVTIPAGVTKVGALAFHSCVSLETVTFERETPPEIAVGYEGHLGSFQNCDKLTTINVPHGCVDAYKKALTDTGVPESASITAPPEHNWNDDGSCACGAQAVAKIGDTYYTDLQDAFDAGGTVELLADVVLPENKYLTVAKDKNLTLNCGDFTLSGSYGSVIYVDGTLDFLGGTLKNTGDGNAVSVGPGGTFNMSAGTLEARDASIAAVSTVGINNKTANVNISGGSVGAGGTGLDIGQYTTVQLSGGTYGEIGAGSGADSASEAQKAVTVPGLLVKDPRYAFFKDGAPVALDAKQHYLEGPVTVELCTHAGATATDNNDGTHNLTCPACGHSATEEPHDWDENYTCVCGAQAVAKIEKAGMDPSFVETAEQLAEAFIDGSNAGATFTLLNNVERADGLGIHINCTLDLNGKTVHATTFPALSTYADTTVTIQGDGTVSSEKSHGLNVDGTTTLEGGTYISGAAERDGVYVNSAVASLSVTGEHVNIRNTGGGYGLAVNYAQSVQLSAGTYEGGTAAIAVYGGGQTLADVLASGYAIFNEDGTGVARTETTTGPGTFTVESCEHKGVEPASNGDGTHTKNCPYCGYDSLPVDCTYTVEYGHDETDHWQTCTVCGYEKKEAHTVKFIARAEGSTVTALQGCETCGYGEELGKAVFTFENPVYKNPDAKVSWTKTGPDNLGVEVKVDDAQEWTAPSFGPSGSYSLTDIEAGEHKLGVRFARNTEAIGEQGFSTECELPFTVAPCPHTGITYTQDEGGATHTGECPLCGDTFTRPCEYGEYEHDETNHWKTCSVCDGKLTAAHDAVTTNAAASGTAVTVKKGCATCGYGDTLGTVTINLPKLVYGELDGVVTASTTLEDWVAVFAKVDNGLDTPVLRKVSDTEPPAMSVLTKDHPLGVGEHTLTVTVVLSTEPGKSVSCDLTFTVNPIPLSGKPTFGSGEGKTLGEVTYTLPDSWPKDVTFTLTWEAGADTQVVRGTSYAYTFTPSDTNYAECSDTVILWAKPSGGGGGGGGGGDTPVNVTGVSLDRNSLTLTIGESFSLTVTITPSNADNKSVTWTSSNPDVASVSGGTVTAVGPGTTTITVTTRSGGYTASCTVTVKAKAYTITYDANGGAGTMRTGSAADGEPFTLPGCTFTPPEGKVFDAWAIGSADGTQTKAGSSHTFTEDTTVYAVWKDAPLVTYAVTYNANGGTGTMTNGIAPDQEAFVLPECGFTAPEGKEFDCWAIGSATGPKVQPGGGYIFTANTTVYALWKDLPPVPYDITGIVWQNGKVVPGATVQLKQGADVIAAQTTGPDGSFTFSGVPAGVYNLVAIKDGITVTVMQEITNSSANLSITLPNGNMNTEVEVKPETPPVIVGGLENIFQDETVYTPEDKEVVDAGGTVEFKLVVEKQDASSSAAIQIEASKPAGQTIGLFLDLSIIKTVTPKDGQAETTSVTQVGSLIETLIPLPDEMQGKASYTVYREHDGIVEALPNSGNGERYTVSSDKKSITIYARKYSTYAVAWSDNGGDTPVDPGKPSRPSGGGGGSSVSTYAVTVSKTTYGKVVSSRTNASSGSTVTLTVIPDSGYTLDTLTLTDSRGNTITLTEKGGGKYTFTMPSRAVTVTASFAPIAWSNPYTDVASGAWYYEAVRFVSENKLMGGYGSGLFGPNDTLTRAQFAQILFNKEGRPAVTGDSIFTDAAPGAWYADAVAWAAAEGIISGYGGGHFGPNDPITREQLAVILWRYAGRPTAGGTLSFPDADKANGYALEALRWAVEQGIISGYSNRLEPKTPATRGQVAQILRNFLQKQ